MKEITIDILKDAAKRLLFDMSDEQYETLLDEFKTTQRQMELIGKDPVVDTLEPMTFPYEIYVSELRDDEPSAPLNRDDALKNAGSKLGGQIKLPKVVQ